MVVSAVLIVERKFDYPQKRVSRAWTASEEMILWRGSPEWHVEQETAPSELRLDGRHHHMKIRDNDPTVRVITDAVFTEYFDPDVLVAHQCITGNPGIGPDIPMELRVESVKYGGGTLVRIVQGFYEPSRVEYCATGQERELNRLEDFLAADPKGISRWARQLYDRSRS